MRKLVLAAVAAGILSIVAIAIAAAHDDHSTGQWPTSCVDLNDIVEEHLGRTGNVGIYQRTFGDQAEAACRNDHRDDVRSVFAWAIGGTEVTAPAPTPISTPAPAPSVATHPDYEEIRRVAILRGASEELATQIAQSVIARGTVAEFLEGVDAGVQYGTIEAITAENFRHRWLDSTGSCWEISYQFTLRNNTSRDMYFDWIEVAFLDGAGFELDSDTIFDVSIAAYGRREISSTEIICDNLGPEIREWSVSFTRL